MNFFLSRLPLKNIYLNRLSKKKIASRLHAQGAYYRQLFDHPSEGIIIVDLEEKVIDANVTFCKLFKYTVEEVKGENINDLIVPQNSGAVDLSEYRRPKELRKTRQDKYGHRIDVSIIGVPIFFNQDLIGSYWIYRDRTDQILKELDSKKNEARFRLLAENINDLICLHRPDGSYDYISPSGHDLLGYEIHELMKINPLNLVHPDDIRFVNKAYAEAIESSSTSKVTYRIKHEAAHYLWLETEIKAITDNGEVTSIITASRDVTMKILADEKIKATLEEKQMLLLEIHHRVKNNLAIVSSLLNMQAQNMKSDKLKRILNESEGRVQTMSMIHELLYQQENFSNIDFGVYIRRLIKHITSNYPILNKSIIADLKTDVIFLEIKTAVPCALIINELLTNAYKHAFTGRKKGKISISLIRTEDYYTLVFSDDGVGFPLKQESQSLGLTLIYGLSKQIGGTVTTEVEHGTTFKITFPCNRY